MCCLYLLFCNLGKKFKLYLGSLILTCVNQKGGMKKDVCVCVVGSSCVGISFTLGAIWSEEIVR